MTSSNTPRHPVGSVVFDRVSRKVAFIVDAHLNLDAPTPYFIYTLDKGIPDDPNYPKRHRLESEICSPDDPTRNEDFPL